MPTTGDDELEATGGTLSCRCELVVARQRLWRLFGLKPEQRRGSGFATALLTPRRDRSPAAGAFAGFFSLRFEETRERATHFFVSAIFP